MVRIEVMVRVKCRYLRLRDATYVYGQGLRGKGSGGLLQDHMAPGG